MTRTLLLGLAAVTLSVPATAQRQPTPEQRIDRLERQTRQIQRRVFPNGQPADTAGVDDAPAASQTVEVAQSARIDALERQLAEMTSCMHSSSSVQWWQQDVELWRTHQAWSLFAS